jgi:hypothetical protein
MPHWLVTDAATKGNDLVRLLGMLLATCVLTACSHVQPWERSKLAHPTMTGDGFVGVAAEHVQAVQEGATGGAGSAGSGCGCN